MSSTLARLTCIDISLVARYGSAKARSNAPNPVLITVFIAPHHPPPSRGAEAQQQEVLATGKGLWPAAPSRGSALSVTLHLRPQRSQ